MTPVKPKWARMEERDVVFAKDQPQYLQLPAAITPDGTVTTRWKLSVAERLKLICGFDLYLKIKTFNNPLQPIKLSVGRDVGKEVKHASL
jgi:hypothetical protein